MKSTKQHSSPIKIIRNIILTVLALGILIYVILNIVFWKKGMPERFFEYKVLENDTVEIKYYSGPFFLLNIPDTIEDRSVTSIGAMIFEKTSFDHDTISDQKHNVMQKYITAVHLPDTVEEIHFWAFKGCNNLRTINIPSKLKYTGSLILAGTKVRKLVFPEGITEIGCGDDVDLGYRQCCEAFSDMRYLNEVIFPESLKKIGNNAFSNCTALKRITLPDSVEEIKYGAFQNSGLTEANIPKSLVNNCGRIFIGTPFEESLEKETTGDFIIFNDVLLYKYIGDDENVVIPDGIESICDRAFWTTPNVKTVEIPESVRYINSAFQFSSVESLVIPDTVDTESKMSFYECNKLKKIVLPDKMTRIQYSAFSECIALESIQLPKSTKVIESEAFSGCRSLEKIIIPASVEEIEDYAFSKCRSLKEVVVEGSPHIGEKVFEDCPALKNKPA